MDILSLFTIIGRTWLRVRGPQLWMSHQDWQNDCPQWDWRGEAVPSSRTHFESTSRIPPLGFAQQESSWYAVHTRGWRKKLVAAEFEEKVCTVLPCPSTPQLERLSEKSTLIATLLRQTEVVRLTTW